MLQIQPIVIRYLVVPAFSHTKGDDRLELPHHQQQIPGPDKTEGTFTAATQTHHHRGFRQLWKRFRGKSRTKVPGVLESIKAIALSSWLNVFLILIPFAWISHFEKGWSRNLVFTLCFLCTIPLEALFDFGGEQMALYCGKDIGDLIIVTLNNAVEAALAIVLLLKCDLKLLQSTITGVVLLHLLLIPGVAFLTGGARIWHQNLHPHPTQLNQSLLTIGVLALLIPTAFFSALDPGPAVNTLTTTAVTEGARALAESGTEPFLNDTLRSDFLSISRGISVILLIVYVCSRAFLYDPPGEGNALTVHHDAPEELHRLEAELATEDPKINPWVGVVLLLVTIGVMAVTAEFLVDSIETVREDTSITLEWFGIILLPLVSFSGDATVTIVYFIRTVLFLRPKTPESLARGRAIDLSIQFTLFWMPFLVLLGWWTNKPLTLLFDLYEVALLLGACFLVNYVTADSKTNWAEGVILCALYIMIALASWYYRGQDEVLELLQCKGITEVVAEVAEGGIGALHEELAAAGVQ